MRLTPQCLTIDIMPARLSCCRHSSLAITYMILTSGPPREAAEHRVWQANTRARLGCGGDARARGRSFYSFHFTNFSKWGEQRRRSSSVSDNRDRSSISASKNRKSKNRVSHFNTQNVTISHAITAHILCTKFLLASKNFVSKTDME